MICKSCQRGGAFNTAANQALKDGFLGEEERYRDAALHAHADCQYPNSCPCEHYTGPSLIRV